MDFVAGMVLGCVLALFFVSALCAAYDMGKEKGKADSIK